MYWRRGRKKQGKSLPVFRRRRESQGRRSRCSGWMREQQEQLARSEGDGGTRLDEKPSPQSNDEEKEKTRVYQRLFAGVRSEKKTFAVSEGTRATQQSGGFNKAISPTPCWAFHCSRRWSESEPGTTNGGASRVWSRKRRRKYGPAASYINKHGMDSVRISPNHV